MTISHVLNYRNSHPSKHTHTTNQIPHIVNHRLSEIYIGKRIYIPIKLVNNKVQAERASDKS